MRNLILAVLALFAIVGLTIWFLQVQQQEAMKTAVTNMKGPKKYDLGPLLARAKKGDLKAQYQLSKVYERGKQVKRNPREAARWLEKAAKKGHIRSALEIGRRYENGTGVKQNYATAGKWYRLAAGLGNDPDAQFALAELYFHGKGVPHSYGEAKTWYQKAANQDNPIAQYLIGVMHQEGWALDRNLIEAYKWYTLAMRHEKKVMAANKRYKPRRSRDAVAAQLNRQQIKEGEKKAKNWRPSRR